MVYLIKILNKIGIKATKENLTWSHVKAYIQSKYRQVLMSDGFKNTISSIGLENYFTLAKYKQEQIVWRYNYLLEHPQGKLCLANNECPCKCTTSEVIISDPACDQKCFPDMMSSIDWAQFKVKNGIFIDLHRNKVFKYIR